MNLQKNTIRVMLVDDHMTMLWGLERLIEAQAPRMLMVGAARTSEEALQQVIKMRPDIVVLDLDLGGISALEIIPNLLSNLQVRVIVLTAERDQKTLDLAVQKGARGIVSKEASAEQVIKAIEKVHQGELWLGREMLGRAFTRLMSPVAPKKSALEADKHGGLTLKEKKIIEAVVLGNGALNKTLAERLFISEHTMRNHLTSIYQKLNVRNRLELYMYAVKHQLVNRNGNDTQ
jgi:two-component system nitrate/nitrite response regulator NarL